MTDDLDPFRLLASAALDNEVDADERAQVEASPEVQREVDVYRGIAAEMRTVDVPALSRESALAAALALFDELDGLDELRNDRSAVAPAVAPAAAVVSLDGRRRRQQLWLGRVGGGLAAAAVVAVLGVVVLRPGSGDEKKSASTVAVLNQTAATVASSAAKSAPAADATLSSTASAQTPNVAGASGGSDTTAAAADTAAAAETAPFDRWAAAPSFTNTDELLAYASATLGPYSTLAAGSTPASTAGTTAGTTTPAPVALAACAAPDNGSFLPVFYGGQRVYLARDDAAGVLRVLDPGNCAEIFSVPLG